MLNRSFSDFVPRDPMEGIERRFQEMLLERLPVAIVKRYPRALIDTAVVQADLGMADRLADDLLVSLHAYVLAERLASGTARAVHYVHFAEPSSPWQMFKRDSRIFRTRWGAAFLERYPVREKIISKGVSLSATWKQYRAFPEADLPVPPERLGQPVRLTFLDTATAEVGDARS